DVLAAGAREPHGVPVVVDDAIGAAQKEKSRRRGCARLRNHAAEELPLGVVAAAAKTADAGAPIAAVNHHRLSDRRIGPGGERGGGGGGAGGGRPPRAPGRAPGGERGRGRWGRGHRAKSPPRRPRPPGKGRKPPAQTLKTRTTTRRRTAAA